MFALILLISVQGLTAFMLPNAVPSTRHARMQTERELQVPLFTNHGDTGTWEIQNCVDCTMMQFVAMK
jgi:hypothetical protein